MRKIIWVGLLVLGALLAPLAVHYLNGIMAVMRDSRPRTTVVRMRDLMGVLFYYGPTDTSPSSLRHVLAEAGRSECNADGWGSPFVIERFTGPEKEIGYRIISLGSDRKRGPCCQRHVNSFAEDAVLESTPDGMAWRQQWTFGRPAEMSESIGSPEK